MGSKAMLKRVGIIPCQIQWWFPFHETSPYLGCNWTTFKKRCGKMCQDLIGVRNFLDKAHEIKQVKLEVETR